MGYAVRLTASGDARVNRCREKEERIQVKRNVLVCSLIAVTGGAVVAQISSGDGPKRAEQPAITYPSEWLDELAAIAEQNPDSASTRLRLGLMLEEMGRGREAQRWFNEAARIDPGLTADVLSPVRNKEDDVPVPTGSGGYPTSGPDVIVGELYDLRRHGRAGDITAFSFGTTSCNAGNQNLLWIANTSQHPVIAQHLYRMKDGRFEMIGQSWLKHGFTALTGNLCASQFGYGCSGQGGSVLGVGCSDPYDGGLNGSYSWLGPKHEVNASKGTFPYPYGSYPNNSPIGKRLQVRDHNLKPALNAGALYFIEGHYIAADDAQAGNGLNNASYRRVNVSEGSTNVFSLSFVTGHPTQRERPAIYAWQDFDPDVTINTVDVQDDGRFIVGYKVTDNGDGTWSYEYAVHNFNSDRSGQAFSLPVHQGVNVTDIGFHAVEWHSGAPYSTLPWDATHEDGVLTWQSQTYAQNANANALRWGTLYNFRFVADAPPTDVDAQITLFKPGGFGTPLAAFVDGVAPQDPPSTLGDLNGDGYVNVSDLLILLGAWGECGKTCPADLNDDGWVDVSDLLIMFANWG